ncbi:MAG: hypothetical protein KA604_00820 [Candidatus Saccharimonas sp.]|jgi:Tfp pilus assembly protein PilE|nr:hypothetical protein [Candidatus Saccharimonas sp.]
MFDRGYSVVEIIVIIVAVAIIAAIAIGADPLLLQRSQDMEREADTLSIRRAFEDYYRMNAATTGPSYPTTSNITSSLDTIATIYGKDIFIAPRQSSYSLVSATSTSSQSPNKDTYIYQPYTPSGTLCSTAPCVRYRLYYFSESANSVKTLDSMRQQ